MMKSLARLSGVDTVFPTEGLLTMRVPLPAARYDSAEKRAAFFEQLAREVEAAPSIRGVVVTRTLPATFTLGTNLQIEGQEIGEPGHVASSCTASRQDFSTFLGPKREMSAQFYIPNALYPPLRRLLAALIPAWRALRNDPVKSAAV
jgi:hypothetical protein